jgi:hypothetical protein
LAEGKGTIRVRELDPLRFRHSVVLSGYRQAQQPPLPWPPQLGVPPPWDSHQAPHWRSMQQLGVRRQAGGWQVVAAFTGALSKAVAARARANRKPVILFIRCSFSAGPPQRTLKNRNFNI